MIVDFLIKRVANRPVDISQDPIQKNKAQLLVE